MKRHYVKLAKECWKSHFRQYGEMEGQRWEESEKRNKNREEKGQKKEDSSARKKVETFVFFPHDLWLWRVENVKN